MVQCVVELVLDYGFDLGFFGLVGRDGFYCDHVTGEVVSRIGYLVLFLFWHVGFQVMDLNFLDLGRDIKGIMTKSSLADISRPFHLHIEAISPDFIAERGQLIDTLAIGIGERAFNFRECDFFGLDFCDG